MGLVFGFLLGTGVLGTDVLGTDALGTGVLGRGGAAGLVGVSASSLDSESELWYDVISSIFLEEIKNNEYASEIMLL